MTQRKTMLMTYSRKRKKMMISRNSSTDYLTHDILFFHILPKLPAKTLLRFTIVSKLWYKSIHDPKFIASHYNHSKSNPSLVAIYQPLSMFHLMYLNIDQTSSSSMTVADIYNTSIRFIIGSCNGLTCIRTSSGIEIFNPTTREILVVPCPKVKNIGFVSYGFGLDPLVNEYKVLLLIKRKCWIHTLGTAETTTMKNYSWRDITVTSNLPFKLRNCLMPYILNGNGAPFWMTTFDGKFVWFDMHHEKFQVIPGPDDYMCCLRPVYSAFQLRGHPCLVYGEELMDGFEFVLYTLNKQSSSDDYNWIKECHTVCIPFKPDTYSIRLVEFSGQIFLQWVSEDGHFYVYNTFTRSKQMKASGMDPVQYRMLWEVLLVNQIENFYSLKTLMSTSPTTVDEAITYVKLANV